MGRVVGDDAFFFYVQDVAVHPHHRCRGLGTAVMQRLRAQVTALAGGTAFLGLFSTPEAEPLYQGTGFAPWPGLKGMWQVLTDEALAGGVSTRHQRVAETRGPQAHNDDD
jgi:GNAT superfamily N-acetyltransferase